MLPCEILWSLLSITLKHNDSMKLTILRILVRVNLSEEVEEIASRRFHTYDPRGHIENTDYLFRWILSQSTEMPTGFTFGSFSNIRQHESSKKKRRSVQRPPQGASAAPCRGCSTSAWLADCMAVLTACLYWLYWLPGCAAWLPGCTGRLPVLAVL